MIYHKTGRRCGIYDGRFEDREKLENNLKKQYISRQLAMTSTVDNTDMVTPS